MKRFTNALSKTVVTSYYSACGTPPIAASAPGGYFQWTYSIKLSWELDSAIKTQQFNVIEIAVNTSWFNFLFHC